VSFFIDPDIVNDPNLDDVTTITLSYTFFPAQDQSLADKKKKEKVS
jgi:cytochrome c oxidase assembly protein subunit 11